VTLSVSLQLTKTGTLACPSDVSGLTLNPTVAVSRTESMPYGNIKLQRNVALALPLSKACVLALNDLKETEY